jgi:hypothetical protein
MRDIYTFNPAFTPRFAPFHSKANNSSPGERESLLEEQLWGGRECEGGEKGEMHSLLAHSWHTTDLWISYPTRRSMYSNNIKGSDPLPYNQGNIRTKDRKRDIYRFDSTCKSSVSLDQFRLEMPGSNHPTLGTGVAHNTPHSLTPNLNIPLLGLPKIKIIIHCVHSFRYSCMALVGLPPSLATETSFLLLSNWS